MPEAQQGQVIFCKKLCSYMDDIRQAYEVLGLKLDASLGDVKQAYRDLVEVWHPDRFSHNQRLKQQAEDKLKQINNAYEELKSTQFNHLQAQQDKSWEERVDNLSLVKKANEVLLESSEHLILREAFLCAHLHQKGGHAELKRKFDWGKFENCYRIVNVHLSKESGKSLEHIEKYAAYYWSLQNVPQSPPEHVVLRIKERANFSLFAVNLTNTHCDFEVIT